MIFQFGTIFLLGLCSLYSASDHTSYTYKGHFSNDTVIKSQYLDITSDDYEYYGLFDLGVNFDFYFNQGSNDYLLDNIVLDTTLTLYYKTNSNIDGTYNLPLSINSIMSYDLPNSLLNLQWNMYNEDDTLHFASYLNSGYQGQTVETVLRGEEFVGDFGFTYSLDLNYLYNQLNEFIHYSLEYQGGYADGYATGYNDGYGEAYQTGFIDGYNDGASQDETAVAIFSGILSVALIPINFFLACLNFEVFGINIGAFVSALLTIAIVVIITRMIISGGNGGEK